MTTRRLYYTDARLHAFDAVIVDRSADGRVVYLAETAFYPTSGGQPHDTGHIGGARVVEVVDEEDRIAHHLDGPVAGDRLPATIDWPRRWDLMQQHTGQHLLSALFDDLEERPTLSVHFGADRSTLDIAGVGISDADLRAVEERAAEVVAAALPVTVTFEDAATAVGLRKPTGRDGEIRVIGIAGIDRSACGGTHVATTAEIGPVFLRGTEKIRDGTRIEFVCGTRAREQARQQFETVNAIAAALRAPAAEVVRFVETQRDQLAAADKARRAAMTALWMIEAAQLCTAAAPGSPGAPRRVELRDPPGGVEQLRAIGGAVAREAAVRFVGTDRATGTVLLATSADSGIDAAAALKPLLTRHGGRGGGNARLAQGGSVPPDHFDAFVAELLAG